MFDSDHPLNCLIEEIKKLPGIGAKSAQRIAYHLIGISVQESDRLADSIKDAKRSTFHCSICNSLTHKDPCYHCTKTVRDEETLCIVEDPAGIPAIEKTGIYHGRYHVLLGTLSPLKGIGPDELNTEKLVVRVKDNPFKEVILATNPTVEGEATAHYIARLLKDSGVKLTRLAMGLPIGSDLDYADQVTIKKSIEGRTDMSED